MYNVGDKVFQSTRPRGARPVALCQVKQRLLFQSTRPRGARHSGAPSSDRTDRVSIHAPAWGATCCGQPADNRLPGFNPRARVGRDHRGRRETLGFRVFQSTRPRGARLLQRLQSSVDDPVSIHAPAWGATLVPLLFDGMQSVSIHAPAWGATSAIRCSGGQPHQFQSTRPRGARRGGGSRARDGNQCFNPRARVGRDRIHRNGHPHDRRVSIHAPAWGATLQVRRVKCHKSVSIHAPAWGATGGRPDHAVQLAVSIHAPAWGATAAQAPACVLIAVSIHAPAWGATASRGGRC